MITMDLRQQEIIDQTVAFVKKELEGAEAGHDWWHIYRVWKLASKIAESEPVNHFLVHLGALLHDIADAKFHNGNEELGPLKARHFLESIQVDEPVIAHVEQIISHVSFRNQKDKDDFLSPELAVIRDADRLDAMGAIGIARAFHYGGYRNREIYNPGIAPNPDINKERYLAGESPTINHFYEKLLLLKEKMHTTTGKKMAESRHNFMEHFLEEFYQEWEGGL